VIVGFADDTCPPPCVYAAYNALQAPKSIIHDVGVPHSDPPSFKQNLAWAIEAPVPVQEPQKKAVK
jgi:cephalosporin-C deacetylase-like acetyl esterase